MGKIILKLIIVVNEKQLSEVEEDKVEMAKADYMDFPEIVDDQKVAADADFKALNASSRMDRKKHPSDPSWRT